MFNQLRGMKDQWLWVVPVLRLTTKLNSTNSGGLQFLGHVQLFVTSWTPASLSFIISWSLLKLMSIESVMPFNHLVLCCPLLLLPSIFPSIRVFSNELALHIRWPKYWHFSRSPCMNIQCWFSLRLIGLISLLSKGLSRVFPAPQFENISSSVLSLLYGPTLISIHAYQHNHSFDYTHFCQQSDVCFLICCLGLW